jgi:very-short-patch-repair endonuclease
MRGYARGLRQRSTNAERLLWAQLRGRRLEGVKFKRQVPLSGFVVDFVALDGKLIVEIDGGQHGERIAEDALRTAALERSGYHVIRFWNHDVLTNIEGVLAAIIQELHLAL